MATFANMVAELIEVRRCASSSSYIKSAAISATASTPDTVSRRTEWREAPRADVS